ncbi:response regulator transcription factor [Butyricicoccus sp.]|uniref:response regulator transcription factor n=1 Tax=Butyricicoccus sp. TaxID=2049021 RepID=UPI003F1629F2
MEHALTHVLIADDEQIVRQGLKHIIDWEALGFCICGEAADGEEALREIRHCKPEVVLLDIRMPRLSGTELIEATRAEGYTGEFIILSGFSEFKYAQAAMRHGVSIYLTKPIDEDELEKALLSIKRKITQQKHREHSLKQYQSKAKPLILADLLNGKELSPTINYAEMGLLYPRYQVVMYEWSLFQPYSFSDLLRVPRQEKTLYEQIELKHLQVVLLKGDRAIGLFQTFLQHFNEEVQKWPSLGQMFLVYGPVVPGLEHIKDSYAACQSLMERKFFCEENQRILSYQILPQAIPQSIALNAELSKAYSRQFVDYIQSCNRRQVSQVLTQLKHMLYASGVDIQKIKYFLTDIFLQVKQSITQLYRNIDIPFAHNAAIMELIESKSYLYEILFYFSEQFEMVIRAIGSNSSASILDDILYYIDHNFSQSLKLETIAPLFGYNSSYLGKLFNQKMGQNFNTYLDHVRINEAMHLLDTTQMKVYEIAVRVGYKNVDYFHQKFKKHVGVSPAEYRKRPKAKE